MAKILHIKSDEVLKRVRKDIDGKKNAAILVYKQGCQDCKNYRPVYKLVRDSLDTFPIEFYRVRFHPHKKSVSDFMREYRISRTPAVVLFKKDHGMPEVVQSAAELNAIRDKILRMYNWNNQSFHNRVLDGVRNLNRVHYGRPDGDAMRDMGILVATDAARRGEGLETMEDVTNQNTVVLFHRPGCPHCVDYMPKYKRIAESAPDHVRVLQVDMAKHGDHVMRFMKGKERTWMSLEGVPTVYMVRPSEGRQPPKVLRVGRGDMRPEILFEKMNDFFKDSNAGKLGRSVASMKQDYGIVCRQGALFGNGKQSYCSLEDAVASDAIVMFHSPTCPACKRAMPLMDRLANDLQKARDKSPDQVTEVKVLTVDHPNNIKSVEGFVRQFNDIVLLGGKGRDNTIQIPVYPSVYIFRKDQPYTALAVRPSPDPNAPQEMRYISLDLLRYAVKTVFPGCGLPSLRETSVFDPLNLRSHVRAPPIHGGGADPEVSLFSMRNSWDSLVGGGDDVSLFSIHDDELEKVSLFSVDESLAGGEEDDVSLFSIEESLAGGEEDDVSLFSIDESLAGGEEDDVSLFSIEESLAGGKENDVSLFSIEESLAGGEEDVSLFSVEEPLTGKEDANAIVSLFPDVEDSDDDSFHGGAAIKKKKSSIVSLKR